MSRVELQAKGVLFDMDGVLVSSIGSVIRSWRLWAEHYGLPNAAEVEVPHGVRAVDIMKAMKPDLDPVEGLALIEEIELNDVADLKVLAGVRELLRSLPAERWAIVTSATRRLLIGRLEAAGLPIPEQIVSADQVDNGKPHPEPYLRGAKLVGAEAKNCVVFEDAPQGVQAGKAAGCRVIAVLGTHEAHELVTAGADWIVESLEKVKATAEEAMMHFEIDTL